MTEQPANVHPERRRRQERRQQKVRVAVERRGGRDRREIQATLSDAERLAQEADDFRKALEHLCRFTRYPTCRDVLLVAHSLGYRRVTADQDSNRS
jgi:hypothetical protein